MRLTALPVNSYHSASLRDLLLWSLTTKCHQQQWLLPLDAVDRGAKERHTPPLREGVWMPYDVVAWISTYRRAAPGLPLRHSSPCPLLTAGQDGFLKVWKIRSVGAARLHRRGTRSARWNGGLAWDLRLTVDSG